jgi:histidine phosphotransferase ChpT
VGAVNNGVEFLEDMGPDSLDDALELIKYSAAQASAKLQAFRYAYGAGGNDPNIKPEDIQRVFSAVISAEGKIIQSWDPYGPLGQKGNPPGFCKTLMACLLLAQEMLPKGGTIQVRPGTVPGVTSITAEGKDAAVRDGMKLCIDGEIRIEDLTPKLVHSYVAGQIGKLYGLSVGIDEESDDTVSITIRAGD